MILRRERRDRWTTVDNTAVEDDRLSFKALGLLVYLLSRPDGWSTNYRQLVRTHRDGEASVRSGLTELQQAGYIERRRIHLDDGTFGWECVVRETADHAGATHDGVSQAWVGPAQEQETEVATTEELGDSLRSSRAPSPVPQDDPQVVELCAYLAERVEKHRGGDRPAVTAAWRRDMRLLVERGALGVDKPEAIAPEKVRAAIDATFDVLAEPGRDGFCWADQVRSPGALRRHLPKLREAYRRATQGRISKGGQAVERVVGRMVAEQRNGKAASSALDERRQPLGLLPANPER